MTSKAESNVDPVALPGYSYKDTSLIPSCLHCITHLPTQENMSSAAPDLPPSPLPSTPPSLLDPTSIPLNLEILPPQSSGELKTYNASPTEIARKQITYRGLGISTDVKTDVQLVACAHGWSRSAKEAARLKVQRERMSLFVFDYVVVKTGVTEEGEKNEVGSVKTEWRFGEVRVKELEKTVGQLLFCCDKSCYVCFALRCYCCLNSPMSCNHYLRQIPLPYIKINNLVHYASFVCSSSTY